MRALSFILFALVLAACGKDDASDSPPPRVVSSEGGGTQSDPGAAPTRFELVTRDVALP